MAKLSLVSNPPALKRLHLYKAKTALAISLLSVLLVVLVVREVGVPVLNSWL